MSGIDMAAAEKVRRNGWEWPWSPRQIVTLPVVCLDFIIFTVFLVPVWITSGYIALGVILLVVFLGSWFVMAVAGFMTMHTDPQDPIIGAERDDPDLLYCRHCDSTVSEESKHCWECRKCVDEFDHHCPWLNTCIGKANYAQFFTAACSNLLMLTVTNAAAIALIVMHASTDMNSLSSLGFLKETGLLVFLIGVLTINVPLWALVLSLVGFHSYLICRGITTYDYLTGKVSARKEKHLEQQYQYPLDESDEGPSGPFAGLVAEEDDSEIKKSVHEFVFGSGKFTEVDSPRSEQPPMGGSGFTVIESDDRTKPFLPPLPAEPPSGLPASPASPPSIVKPPSYLQPSPSSVLKPASYLQPISQTHVPLDVLQSMPAFPVGSQVLKPQFRSQALPPQFGSISSPQSQYQPMIKMY
jgi:hypothetical protein